MGGDVEAGAVHGGSRSLTEGGHASLNGQRIVRVVPDISGLDAEFDYLVPKRFEFDVSVGSIVRITLHNRRVRGWVVADDTLPPAGVKLKELDKITGVGPSREVIELAGWAAERWVGRRSFHLQTGSPLRVVKKLPLPAVADVVRNPGGRRAAVEVLRLPPAESPLETVLGFGADHGNILLVAPSQRSAEGWTRRLRAEGWPVASYPDQWDLAATGRCTVVGTRAAAWATSNNLAGVVVVDAHDRALQSESSPTWSAVEVMRERARRASIPFLATTPVPHVAQLQDIDLVTVSRDRERVGWAPLHVVDLRRNDPREGLYTHAVVDRLRKGGRSLVILNRKGRAQLLSCVHCNELARCGACGGSQEMAEAELRCRRCRVEQPIVCRHCGGTKYKQLRIGVSRLREELEALAMRPVGEVSSDTVGIPDVDVIVGTEALLYRADRADAVIFIDFDQELSRPRMNAAEDALILLARASRIVGGRNRGGVVLVQTRQPEHEVIESALHADPGILQRIELERRQTMRWPPFCALARVSGKAAAEFVERLTEVDLLGPIDGRWLARADDHQKLSKALRAAGQSKLVRIEVDPPDA